MSKRLPFTLHDVLLLKWHLLLLLTSIVIATGIIIVIDSLQQNASRDLATAQRELREIRTLVSEIEEEEDTIIEYIGRYNQMESESIVGREDRLQLLERIAEIRAEYGLFPISVNIGEQSGIPLEYPPEQTDPGGPVDLRFSRVELSMPLLHEEDLTRLLSSLLNSPGLYQVESCSIDLRSTGNNEFFYLAQHFTAECSLFWYRFDLNPATEGSLQ